MDRAVLEEHHLDVPLRALAWEGRRLLDQDDDEAFLLRDESEDVLDTYRACKVRVCASTLM